MEIQDVVKFRYYRRSTYNNLPVKDENTLYFIKGEKVFYKGTQEYGGIQSLSYSEDSDGNYILTITNGDGSTSSFTVASARNLKTAITDLENHIDTIADEDTEGHVKLTDTINTTTPQEVSDGVAVTPKGVVDYVNIHPCKNFLKYESRLKFPLVGVEDTLYLAMDKKFLWIWNGNGYELISDNWKSIEQIIGIVE